MAIKCRLSTVFFVIVLGGIFSFSCTAGAAGSLLADVVELQLGWNGYVIGKQLDGVQKKVAENNPLQGAYEGTYKFADADLHIVADLKTDRVLALYKQKKKADKQQLKAMVVELMGRFGEPTTMAHDKILYCLRRCFQQGQKSAADHGACNYCHSKAEFGYGDNSGSRKG